MRWRSGARGGTGTTPDELAPIRIFTSDLELSGFVAPTGQRVTDILLRGQDLAFLPDGAEAAPENWIWISPAEILVVVPPPLPSSGWRPDQQLHQMALQVGRYAVSGTAHLEMSDRSVADLGRRQHFLPLTEAELAREGGADAEPFDVLIVNVARSGEAAGDASRK